MILASRLFLVIFGCLLSSLYASPSARWLGPPEDGLDWIGHTLVAEREDTSSRWWYTPSRKSHFYAEKYQPKGDIFSKGKSLKSERADDTLRLPTNIKPISYNIQLIPLLNQTGDLLFTSGSVEIVVECINASLEIVMNAKDIMIFQEFIEVRHASTNNRIDIFQFIDEQLTRETVTIRLFGLLQPGERYKIIMAFQSLLTNPEFRGFYRSFYLEDGVQKFLGASQMEPIDARRAFPCFDEPHFKARFNISLAHYENMIAASNMPIAQEGLPVQGMPGYVMDVFEETPEMSTYLVAFLVAEFWPSSSVSGRIPYRLWTRPEVRKQTGYILEKVPAIQEFFEKILQVNYSLPKQDLVALPDFRPGAMENWGLVTFKEENLLINPATASRNAYQKVASITAHELAHQWFGNLVTTEWWNSIWLNEGFATYWESIGTHEVEPNWEMEAQANVNDLHYVFYYDGLDTTRPLTMTSVNTREEISAMFDTISYEKGGCVIRMMADFLGADTFRKGLTQYLNGRANTNAVPEDLFQAMQSQAAFDRIPLPDTVSEIMNTWTLQKGYPVVTVERNYLLRTATVTQERFLLRRGQLPDPAIYRWWIPLTYITAENNTARMTDWLPKTETIKTIRSLPESDQWILFNVDQLNYYRVAYDKDNYRLLTDQLRNRHQTFSSRNRAQLLDDAFNLAQANLIPYKSALDLTVYLKNEREYVPWRSVLTELDYIDIMLRLTDIFPDWKMYMKTLIEPYYMYVGFNEGASDSHLLILSRIDALNWACRLEISYCVENAKERYAALMSQPDLLLSPNQKNVILRTGVEQGKGAEFNFAYDQYLQTGDTVYLEAACATRNADLVYKLLENMINSTSGIRPKDIPTLFKNVAANPAGHPLALSFLINRWDEIEKSLGTGFFVDFFVSLSGRLSTEDQLAKYLELRNDHSNILGASNNAETAIVTATYNIIWIQLHVNEVKTWLMEQDSTTTLKTTSTTMTTQSTTTLSTPSTTTLSTPSTTTLSTPSTTTLSTPSTTTLSTPSTTTKTSPITSTSPSTSSSSTTRKTSPTGMSTSKQTTTSPSTTTQPETTVKPEGTTSMSNKIRVSYGLIFIAVLLAIL